MGTFLDQSKMLDANTALPGRSEPITIENKHFVNGHSLTGPFPDGMEVVVVGMGCFWGAERLFWKVEGVYSTAVGYTGGITPNPTYEEVCSGRTGHTEAVLIVFDPTKLPLDRLLALFWENHNPTQGMRQGNDLGTQYRSGIYTASAAQHESAIASSNQYGEKLRGSGFGDITTEIADAGEFYYAEDYHQQYLAKNVDGYCGIGGTGVACPIGLPTE